MIYLAHMHPVLKNLYTPWNVFSYMEVNQLYFLFVSITCILIIIVGIIMNFGIKKWSFLIYRFLKKRISQVKLGVLLSKVWKSIGLIDS